MRKYFYLFFVLFFFQIAFSQNIESIGTTPETKAIDKKLDDIAEVSKAFIDPKHETVLLKIKDESEKIGYKAGVLRSGDYLCGLYLGQRNSKAVIDLGNKLKKVAKDQKDTYGHISSIYRRNALALGYIGLDEASLKDFKKAISYAETIENEDKKNYVIATSYENMTVYYENKKFDKTKLKDSMEYYYLKSLEVTDKISDHGKPVPLEQKYGLLSYVNMSLGIYHMKIARKINFPLAEKYLLEGYKIQNNKRYTVDPYDKIYMYNQLGYLYLKTRDYKKSIEYLNAAMALEKQHSYPASRIDSFETLAQVYVGMGDKEKSELYMNKYALLVDSLDYVDKKEADLVIKKMVAEVDQQHKESSKKQWMITGIFVLIAGLVTAILWRRKNKALRRKYEQMMVNLKNGAVALPEEVQEESNENDTETESEQELTSKNTISADTVARILKKLATFEKSEKYLKKDLTISSLAGQLNTNTKYLSEVIKNNTSQNFNHYINNLRINYIVHKLYNEPKYREYKISYLAEECGFASSQVFVIAFKKINGLTPSYFIQSLKEDKVNISV
ncbi:helix-turn-helix domain-containing protein [Chryseobacterium sp.]|uniref:helix-turn-helix domain-containing protein n=1 Tax=Chryseobacterium sp. TaxID=1871047 RepID=UPI0012CBC052|nr:helix-turn-helix domain-containing protein [Chryseobacterium sp.]MPS63453.1 helix-turn-helix domain-containing protein [Chryseobacterium sp.]